MPSSKKKIKPLTGNHGDFSGIVLKAAARGDVAAVEHYLQVHPEWLNREGPHGRTLLWEAAYRGRVELVAKLIARGADVNPQGSYYTPLLVELSALAVARLAERSELIDLLAQHGARDDIYAATHRGDLNTMEHFLSADPELANRPSRIEPPHPRMGFHPLHYAAAGQQLGATRLLIGHGALIGEHLPLLLDWASENRELVRYLRAQAKVQGAPTGRRTDTEARQGVPAIDRPDWLGFPPLVDACRGNHNAPDDPARVSKLLAQGANVNIRDHKGKTPLHRAAQAGFIKITRLLLKHGAELEAADLNGDTPIFDAAHHGREAALQLLIDEGAQIAHVNNRLETALFAATRGSHSETFQILLDAGADPTQRNKRGQTVVDFIQTGRRVSPGRQRILDALA